MYSDSEPLLCKNTGVCTSVAVECISGVLSGMGVLSGVWFLHRIGISIIHATLCFVVTIIQTSASPRFVFGLYFPYKTKVGMDYILIIMNDDVATFF